MKSNFYIYIRIAMDVYFLEPENNSQSNPPPVSVAAEKLMRASCSTG